MDFDVDYELALRLLLSFIIGTAIGMERQYRSKAAGLRTMIVICLGSTIFTELSMSMSDRSPDRIASNIITGIGFLGAGVIFKDGLTISGITTATTIWIVAALGMAVGAGEYFVALVGSGVVLIVLTFFERIQLMIEKFHQARSYKISFVDDVDFVGAFEKEITRLKLGFQRKRDMKDHQQHTILYEVFGRESRLDELNIFLKREACVKSYEY